MRKLSFVPLLAMLLANSGCALSGAMGSGENVSTLQSKPLESGHAPVDGINMYYEVHGRRDGVPLILLHGGGSTIEVTFSRVLPVFASSRRVIAVEEQGHGRTTDRNAPVTFESSAEARIESWYNGYSPAERDSKLEALKRLVTSGDVPVPVGPCQICGTPESPVEYHSEDYAQPR